MANGSLTKKLINGQAYYYLRFTQRVNGTPKVVQRLSYPPTALDVVTRVYTDMAVLSVTADGFVLEEVAPGLSVEDVRAACAAELVVPHKDDWLRRIDRAAASIARAGRQLLEDRGQELDWLARRLVASSPAVRLQRQTDLLRENQRRLRTAIQARLLQLSSQLQSARGQLLQRSPAIVVQRTIAQLRELRQRLATATRNQVSDRDHQLALLGRALHAVSPLATLERGYAIVKNESTGKVLTRAADVETGQDIHAELSRGSIVAQVTKVMADE